MALSQGFGWIEGCNRWSELGDTMEGLCSCALLILQTPDILWTCALQLSIPFLAVPVQRLSNIPGRAPDVRYHGWFPWIVHQDSILAVQPIDCLPRFCHYSLCESPAYSPWKGLREHCKVNNFPSLCSLPLTASHSIRWRNTQVPSFRKSRTGL
jgi:hypothetical protein